MEVLFITHKYPPSIGGMEKQSYELINGVAENHPVHTLIYDNKTSKLKFFLSVFFKVRRMLKQHPDISIIHVNDGLMAIFAFLLKRITNVPILVTIHGLDIVFPSSFFQRWVVKQFKKLDGVIAVSQATAMECLKRGFDNDKVFVVRNGVDTDLKNIYKQLDYKKQLENRIGLNLSGKKILVSVGRSVRRKGFSWFIKKVMPQLDDNTIYLIIGPPQRHIKKINIFLKLLPKKLAHNISLLLGLPIDAIEIQEALGKPEVKGKAFYLGKLPFEEMAQVLKHSDLFIMPNIKVNGDAEGFGLVALEAAICGLPVLASAIEGITDAVIDGKNGVLAPSGKETEWVRMINDLLRDTQSLKKFGKESQKYTIKNYDWKKMVSGYVAVFNKFNEKAHEVHETKVMKEASFNDDFELESIAVYAK